MYQIDHTKTAKQNLSALASQDFVMPSGAKLEDEDYTHGVPAVIVPSEANGQSNTSLQLNGNPLRGLPGSSIIQYNRIPLAENRPSAGTTLKVGNADTKETIAARVRERWRLVDGEAISTLDRLPFGGTSRNVRFSPKKNSVIYTPDSHLDIVVQNTDPNVNVPPVGLLFGFNAAAPYSEESIDYIDEVSGHSLFARNGSVIRTDGTRPGQYSSRTVRHDNIMGNNPKHVMIPNAIMPNLADPDFGDFTIELWACFHTQTAGTSGILFSQWESGTPANNVFRIQNNGNSSLQVYWGPHSESVQLINAAGTVSINAWFHLALTRVGNTYQFYRLGSQVGSVNSTARRSVRSTANGAIGTGYYISSNDPLVELAMGGSSPNAFVEQVAIWNYAKYTANFTPASIF